MSAFVLLSSNIRIDPFSQWPSLGPEGIKGHALGLHQLSNASHVFDNIDGGLRETKFDQSLPDIWWQPICSSLNVIEPGYVVFRLL